MKVPPLALVLATAVISFVLTYCEGQQCSLYEHRLTDEGLRAVRERLESRGIPSETLGDGRVFVHPDLLMRARFELALEGLPQAGDIHYLRVGGHPKSEHRLPAYAKLDPSEEAALRRKLHGLLEGIEGIEVVSLELYTKTETYYSRTDRPVVLAALRSARRDPRFAAGLQSLICAGSGKDVPPEEVRLVFLPPSSRLRSP